MSASIADLPNGLIERILRFVPNRENLEFVSKQFYEAISFIESEKLMISVTSSQLLLTKENVKAKLANENNLIVELQSFNLPSLDFFRTFGEKIKTLSLNGKFSFESLNKILKLTPNCEILDLSKIQRESAPVIDDDCDEIIHMNSLKCLTIALNDEGIDKLIGDISAPRLHNITVHFDGRGYTSVPMIFSTFSHIKSLAMKNSPNGYDFPFLYREPLLNLRLEELTIEGFRVDFVKSVLNSQRGLKKLVVTRLGACTRRAVTYENLSTLESLVLDSFDGDFQKFAPLRNLKSLEFVFNSRRIFSAYPPNPNAFNGVRESLKNLRHFSFYECTPERYDFLMQVLSNFPQIESIELTECRKVTTEITKKFLDVRFIHSGMKSLKIMPSMPFSCEFYEKFIKVFPNVERLEMAGAWLAEGQRALWRNRKLGNELGQFDHILRLFNEAESSKNKSSVKQEIFKRLSGINFLNLPSGHLAIAQVCIFHLGFKSLKKLKLILDKETCDELDMVRNIVGGVKEFEVVCCEKPAVEHRGEISSEMISNYGTFDTILNTKRIVRNFSLTFPENVKVPNFPQFEAIFTHFGPYVRKLTLKGVITDQELLKLLKLTPNCKTLIFSKFCVIKTSNDEYHLDLKLLKHLEINDNVSEDLSMYVKDNNCTKFEFFNNFKLPDDCLTTFKYTTNSRGNFEVLNRLLGNQGSLEELEITSDYLSTIIPENFLTRSKLKKLVINASFLSDAKESFKLFRKRQQSLEYVQVDEN